MIMNKMLITIASVSMLAASPLTAAEVVHNSNPSVPFTYGSGNDYTPANASVLKVNPDAKISPELAARFHITGEAATPSVDGVYSFALGAPKISFDYSLPGDTRDASVKLTNLLTGAVAQYFASAIPDANGPLAGYQGSQQLGFGFLNGGFPPFGNLGFNKDVDNTYRFDLTSSGNTLTTFAKVGNGFNPVAAVPEPATWMMLLFGFFGIGASMRSKKITGTRVNFA